MALTQNSLSAGARCRSSLADLARWLSRLSDLRLLVVFIVAHTIAWTLMPMISRTPGALWDDMLEAYAWGQQWQLGYYKHPPFYSWTVGLWFELLPRADWAFYLLSAVNVGVGIAGIWALAGQFLKPEARLLSVLLLTFMPYYNYMASNYNANTILLALWPWTAYAFVRSMATRSLTSALAFGALGAAGLLSKYYSVLLLASCFGASLLHPEARRYYRSAAPYVAIATALLLLLPHAWWAIANDLPPVRYALGKTGQPWSTNFHKAVTTAIASIAMNSIAVMILVAAMRWRRPAIFSGLWVGLVTRERWWLLVLATGPFVATILLGIAGYVKIAVNFLIPVFFMLPLLLMLALERAITRDAVRAVLRAVWIFLLGAVVIAPAVAYVSVWLQLKGTVDVNDIAAVEAAQAWRKAFGTPVRIVAGSEKYSLAQPFYGPDSPAEFTHFRFNEAPWITRARIEGEGLLSICAAVDQECFDLSNLYANAGTRIVRSTISTSYGGIHGPAHELAYILTPPRR